MNYNETKQFIKLPYMMDLILPKLEIGAIKAENNDVIAYDIPFIEVTNLERLKQIVKYAKMFKEKYKGNNLYALKQSIFNENAEKKFKKFLIHKEDVYHTSVDKNTSKIIAETFENSSSLYKIKPMHQYEKIKSYIDYIIKDSSFGTSEINISVLGNLERTEIDGKMQYAEAFDLCRSLYLYLNEEYKNNNISKPINLNIKYYLNTDCQYDANGKKTFTIDENGSECKIIELKDDEKKLIVY